MSELTFEQMLEESCKTIHNGEVVEGTVIQVKPEEIILNIWHKLNGENAYVVDPLSHKQALYYIFRWEIPFTKFIIPFLRKEHVYEED